jgi:hypothetical protein
MASESYWVGEFRRRMAEFGPAAAAGQVPISIKIRIGTGCFHREHSPVAYRMIDQHLAGTPLAKLGAKFEEHETGPEILAYAAIATSGITLAKSLIDLVVVILKARSEGLGQGDRQNDPVEVIIRRIDEKGGYKEEKILRVPPGLGDDTGKIVKEFFKTVAPADRLPDKKKKAGRRRPRSAKR